MSSSSVWEGVAEMRLMKSPYTSGAAGGGECGMKSRRRRGGKGREERFERFAEEGCRLYHTYHSYVPRDKADSQLPCFLAPKSSSRSGLKSILVMTV